MDIILLVIHVAVYIWLMFFGGAERLEGSFSTIFFFHPSMTVRELKFYATLSLVMIPVYFYIA
jgi:hypothetical protein